MTHFDPKLAHLALRAVRSPQNWKDVLQHIVDSTPAVAAIITLRDGVTCQIINDNALEQEYHSPLVLGFSEEAVAYYLEELRTIDPWAEAQRQNYPHRPMAMSRVCHPDKCDDRRFFDWLEIGGLRETVAFELERFSGYWTAINLFLEHRDEDRTNELLRFCELHFELLREAWSSCQHVVRCQQSGQAALEQLSTRAVPACIITSEGTLLRTNAAFHRLVAQGAVKASGPSDRLSVCGNAELIGSGAEVDEVKAKIHFHEIMSSSCAITISAFNPDPLYQSKKGDYWLLTFNRTTGIALDEAKHVYDIAKLDDQERRLFDGLCRGSTTKEAGAAIGVRRTRAFEIWSEIKIKLEISSVQELRGALAIISQKTNGS